MSEWHEAYNQGTHDAWNIARTIHHMSAQEMYEVFGGCSYWVDYTFEEVNKLITEYYKKKHDEIKVGDEVECSQFPTLKGVIVQVVDIDDGGYKVLQSNGCGAIWYKTRYNEITKTGNHYPQIEEVFKKLGFDGRKRDESI